MGRRRGKTYRKNSSQNNIAESYIGAIIEAVTGFLGATVMSSITKYQAMRAYAKGRAIEFLKSNWAFHSWHLKYLMFRDWISMFRPNSWYRRSTFTSEMVSFGALFGLLRAVKAMQREEEAKKLPTYTDDTLLYRTYNQTIDNRYAWRLNCEDGSEFGVEPENYETRQEYHDALRRAREAAAKFSGPEADGACDTLDGADEPCKKGAFDPSEASALCGKPASPAPTEMVCLCRVSLLGSGKTRLFRTNDPGLRCGKIVSVPDGDGTDTGVVVSVTLSSIGKLEQPLESIKEIIGPVGEG